jgi:hypothetical protein
VSGKSHENEAISGFPYPEEVGPTPSWVAGVVRDGKDEKIVPMEAYRYMLAGVREGKMEIPGKTLLYVLGVQPPSAAPLEGPAIDGRPNIMVSINDSECR